MRVPLPSSRNGRRIYVSIWDLFWALISPIVALYFRDVDLVFQTEWTIVGYYWCLSAGFALLAFLALRVQDGMTRFFSVHEALDIAEAVLFAELMTCGVLFTLTRLDGIPRSMPLIHGILLASGLIASRVIFRIVFSEDGHTQDYQSRRERIILIGANRFASSFIQLLRAYAPQQQPVIAVLDSDAGMIGRAVSGVQVLGAPHELDSVITEFGVHGVTTDRVVIAGEVDFLSPAVLNEIERICEKRKIALCFLPRILGITEWRSSDQTIRSEPLQLQPSVALPRFFRLKRCIDIAGALILIVLFFPVLMVAGILVLADVGTPVLFWQERLGWKRRSFLIYKFRTLGAPFDSDGLPISGTREPSSIGRFLRGTRIDELPQLLNVLLGDMSLVGPRPLLPEDQPSNISIRLSVRPGITGWAQVNGAKLVAKEQKEKLDEWYVRNASLWVDSRIMAMTLALILKSRISSKESVADEVQVRSKNIGLNAAPAPSPIVFEKRQKLT
jgi:lipopolysaccharide/colanic/teichoic acid biosynthesis glycosyltransferase